MKHSTRKQLANVGEIILITYLIIVAVIAIMRALTGYPTIDQLASSPSLLAHGQWWRLVTSAFIIEGPPIIQIVAIGVLGTLGIYMGGSWVFWLAALAGHFFGTLVTYVGVIGIWLSDRTIDAQYMTNPDYGVSLVWCAALGVFCAIAWFGDHAARRRPARPALVAASLAVIIIVTIFSDPMTATQHAIAFVCGYCIMAFADRPKALKHDEHLKHAVGRIR